MVVDRPSNNRIASHTRLRSSSFASVLWNRGQAITLTLLAMVLPGCNQSVTLRSDTTISEIANESNTDLIDKTVTVSGEVDQILGPKAFIIEGDQLFNDPEVLVVNATEAPIIDDTLVQVTGTVREFVGSEIERKFDLDLAQEFEVEFRGKLMLDQPLTKGLCKQACCPVLYPTAVVTTRTNNNLHSAKS